MEAARIAGLAPDEVLRFDGNTPPQPPAYANEATIADALAEIQRYPHGGFPALLDAIAEYAGVETERIVLGAGADDLLLLCGRAFAGPGDVVRVLDEPTYPVFRLAAWLAGADVGDEGAVLTYCCRPHNPTGSFGPLPGRAPARRRRGLLRVRRRDGRRHTRRDRGADVLQGVRARRRARRLRRRGR